MIAKKTESEIVEALILEIQSVIDFLEKYQDQTFKTSLEKFIGELREDAVRCLSRIIGWTKNVQKIKKYFDLKIHRISELELDSANLILMKRMNNLHQKSEQAKLAILAWFVEYYEYHPNQIVKNMSPELEDLIKGYEELYDIALTDNDKFEIDICEERLASLRNGEDKYLYSPIKIFNSRGEMLAPCTSSAFSVKAHLLLLPTSRIIYIRRIYSYIQLLREVLNIIQEDFYDTVYLSVIKRVLSAVESYDLNGLKYVELLDSTLLTLDRKTKNISLISKKIEEIEYFSHYLHELQPMPGTDVYGIYAYGYSAERIIECLK